MKHLKFCHLVTTVITEGDEFTPTSSLSKKLLSTLQFENGSSHVTLTFDPNDTKTIGKEHEELFGKKEVRKGTYLQSHFTLFIYK